MTRDAFKSTVWQWQCDVCLKHYGRVEVAQGLLPDLDAMHEKGWSIGRNHGDACPECVAAGKTPSSPRWTPDPKPRARVCTCWRLKPDGSHGRGCNMVTESVQQ